MAYWKDSSKNTRPLDSFGLATNHTSATGGNREFHELELGVVLDIVLDLSHPIYTKTNPMQTQIDSNQWPADLKGVPPATGDKDLTWIGRCLIRPLVSGKNTPKDQLKWAYPMENNFSEYPLINETVMLYESSDGNRLYYSKVINFRNLPNNNLDFTLEGASSGVGNTILFTNSPYTGRIQSQTNWNGAAGRMGYAGKYYYANPKIRTIHRFEGDTVLESRHGSGIIIKAFDKNRGNDMGAYSDYVNSGNPMLILRNRQRQLLGVGETLTLKNSPNLATVKGTVEEKNVGGYLDENINHDGSSIYMTSGQTVSEWVTTCYKKMFGTGEEVTAFNGTTNFIYPKLNGDQIVIHSDRLVLSARYGELFQYSKKRHGIVTDSEYTVDAHDQIVMTTHVKTVLNSPLIYLGEYDQSGEPALLGQTTVNWLYELCNILIGHTHWHQHTHSSGTREDPQQTQPPVQVLQLMALRDNLQAIMSRRVFITGGGFAPGQDGAKISNLPVISSAVNITTGAGVPGGFNAGSNKTPAESEANAAANIAAISSEAAKVNSAMAAIKAGLISSIPGLPAASDKLSALSQTYSNKLKASQSAPNFSVSYALPSPPKPPSTPNFSNLGIPAVPSLPSI